MQLLCYSNQKSLITNDKYKEVRQSIKKHPRTGQPISFLLFQFSTLSASKKKKKKAPVYKLSLSSAAPQAFNFELLQHPFQNLNARLLGYETPHVGCLIHKNMYFCLHSQIRSFLRTVIIFFYYQKYMLMYSSFSLPFFSFLPLPSPYLVGYINLLRTYQVLCYWCRDT